jgi:hypothetical protein
MLQGGSTVQTLKDMDPDNDDVIIHCQELRESVSHCVHEQLPSTSSHDNVDMREGKSHIADDTEIGGWTEGEDRRMQAYMNGLGDTWNTRNGRFMYDITVSPSQTRYWDGSLVIIFPLSLTNGALTA